MNKIGKYARAFRPDEVGLKADEVRIYFFSFAFSFGFLSLAIGKPPPVPGGGQWIYGFSNI
ncbi:MAG: hypothetical protein LUQ09_00605 [Methanomassiliicoccales archaeon]|nr:hypothetical protein [Methanomassiliicoccales archaeon]